MTEGPSQDRSADGETALFLVRNDGRRGLTSHIPDASGHPICGKRLNLSLWQLEVHHITLTVICNQCKAIQAKQGRS